VAQGQVQQVQVLETAAEAPGQGHKRCLPLGSQSGMLTGA